MTETVSKIGEAFDCKVMSQNSTTFCLSLTLTLLDGMLHYHFKQRRNHELVKSKNQDNFISQPVEGMLSHQLEQNRIDGEKTIIQVFRINF